MKKWKAVVGVVLVFLLGALSGALFTRVCWHEFGGGRHVNPDAIVRRLDRELKLDPAQKEEVRKIVAGVHAQMQAMKKENEPRVEALLDKAQDEVRAVLRPEQRERYEKFIANHKERWKKRRLGEGQ